MSRENVEAWGKAIQAFNERDFEGLVADFAPEIEFRPLITGMTGQPYRGHQGVREWLEAIDEDWETFVTTVDRWRTMTSSRLRSAVCGDADGRAASR